MTAAMRSDAHESGRIRLTFPACLNQGQSDVLLAQQRNEPSVVDLPANTR